MAQILKTWDLKPQLSWTLTTLIGFIVGGGIIILMFSPKGPSDIFKMDYVILMVLIGVFQCMCLYVFIRCLLRHFKPHEIILTSEGITIPKNQWSSKTVFVPHGYANPNEKLIRTSNGAHYQYWIEYTKGQLPTGKTVNGKYEIKDTMIAREEIAEIFFVLNKTYNERLDRERLSPNRFF